METGFDVSASDWHPTPRVLAQLYESMTDGVVFFDGENRIVSANPGMALITGRSVGDLVGRTAPEAWREESRTETLSSSLGPISEKTIVRPDGTQRLVSARMFPLSQEDGSHAVIYRDVTRLRRRERMTQALYESTSAATGKEFFENLVVAVTRAVGTRFGLVGEIVGGTRVNVLAFAANDELLPPFSFDLEGTPCQAVLTGGVCVHPRGVRKLYPHDAMLRDLGAEAYLGMPLWNSQGQKHGLLVIVHDEEIPRPRDYLPYLEVLADRAGAEIERLRSNAALRESENRFRTLFEQMPNIAIQGMDREGRVTFWNKASHELYGYTAEEASRRPFEELLLPGTHREVFRSALRDWADRDLPIQSERLEIVGKSGRRVTVLSNFLKMTGASGDPEFYCLNVDLTELEAAREALEISERRYRQLVEAAPLAIAVLKAGRLVYLNGAGHRLFGVGGPEELDLSRVQWWPSEGALNRWQQFLARAANSSPVLRPEFEDFQLVRSDGQALDLEAVAIPVLYEGAPALQLIANDVTDRKRADRRLRVSEERYALAARGANDGLWDWNLETNSMYFSPRWQEMIGLTDEDAWSPPEVWLDRIHPEDRPEVDHKLQEHLAKETPHFESEHRIRCGDGQYRWMVCRGVAVFSPTGQPVRIAGSLRDVTERRLAEERLYHEAMHDSLTNLANRSLFLEHLEHALNRSARLPGYLFAVLFLDLDRFKVVNDSLGHLVGDRLLVEIAERLQRILRPSDLFARLGGDEFAILVEDLRLPGEARMIAERLHKELARPFLVEGKEIYTSASIGIAFSSAGYERPEEILRDADTAMYRAKDGGRARHIVFDRSMRDDVQELLDLESDLHRALERQEFDVHFQPLYHTATLELAGFEALVRWNHPERGRISPADFIALAEETGVILPVGLLVLEKACAALRRWEQEFPDLIHGRFMAVNISGRQLNQTGLAEDLRTIIERTGCNPGALKLEITETVLMAHPEVSIAILGQLRDQGVSICIDDFGTGYSSLNYLHRLPLDTVKIDRAFVDALSAEDKSALILPAVASLSSALGLSTIAEGIENEEQLARVREYGCDFVQGFLMRRPEPESEIRNYLAEIQAASVKA